MNYIRTLDHEFNKRKEEFIGFPITHVDHINDYYYKYDFWNTSWGRIRLFSNLRWESYMSAYRLVGMKFYITDRNT